jgi:hypothetical protein
LLHTASTQGSQLAASGLPLVHGSCEQALAGAQQVGSASQTFSTQGLQPSISEVPVSHWWCRQEPADGFSHTVLNWQSDAMVHGSLRPSVNVSAGY